MDNTEQHRVISLCTGMRGIERGLERAGLNHKTVAYVEIEAFIIENLVSQMEAGFLDPAPIWSNLKTFDGKPFRNRIHGITGGYPCQPFSHAGSRKGSEDPRHLWPYIERLIQDANPVWCFFENVEGHLTNGFPEVYQSLRNLGYKIEAGIFSASEVGAPHQRKRLFILAIREGKKLGDSGLFRSSVNEQQTARIEQSSKTMANPVNNRHNSDTGRNGKESGSKKKDGQGIRGGLFERTGSELADSDGDGHRTGPGTTGKKSQKIERKEHGKRRDDLQRERMRSQSGIDGKKTMADTNNTRFKERRKSVTDETSHITTECTGQNWPAAPGQHQHEWEEPRQIKSGMGCTINGFDFRTDLLRALGNGVVPQTAELAFRTLIKKFN